MAKINRPNRNIQAFATNTASGERTVFNGDQVTDDIALNINEDYERGFKVYGPEDVPEIKDFNALGFTAARQLSYLFQSGVAEWASEQEYNENQICEADGVLYVSNVDNNIGNSPVDVGENPAWTLETSKLSNCDEQALISISPSSFAQICLESGKLFLYSDDDGQFSLVTNNPSVIITSDDLGDKVVSYSITNTVQELNSSVVGGLSLSNNKSNILIAQIVGNSYNLEKPIKGFDGKITGSSTFGSLSETSTGNFRYIIQPVGSSDFLAIDYENGITYLVDYASESISQTSVGEVAPLSNNPVNDTDVNYSDISPSFYKDGYVYICNKSTRVIYRNSTKDNYSSFDEIVISTVDAGSNPINAKPSEITFYNGKFYLSVSDFNGGGSAILSTVDFVNFSEVVFYSFINGDTNYLGVKGLKEGIVVYRAGIDIGAGDDGIISEKTSTPEDISSYENFFSFTPNFGGWAVTIYHISGSENQLAFRGLTNEVVTIKDFNGEDPVRNGPATSAIPYYDIVMNLDGSELIVTADKGDGVIVSTIESILSNNRSFSACSSGESRIFAISSGLISAYDIDLVNGKSSKVGNNGPVSIESIDYSICSISSQNLASNNVLDYILVYTSASGEINCYTFDGLNFEFYGLVYTSNTTASKSQLVQLTRGGGEVVFNDRGEQQFVKISVGAGGVFSVDAIVSNSNDFSNPLISEAVEGEFAVIDTNGTDIITYDFNGSTPVEVSRDMMLGLSGLDGDDIVALTTDRRVVNIDSQSLLSIYSLQANPVQSQFWRFVGFDNISFSGEDVGIKSNNLNDAIKDILLNVKYRVGSIYKSINPTPPNTVLGFGAWQKIEGKMLIGVDPDVSEIDAGGKTGGSFVYDTDEAVLTGSQIPNHGHDIILEKQGNNKASEGEAYATKKELAQGDFNGFDVRSFEATGGGQGHSHQITTKPPFYAINIWVRTS